MKNTIGQGGMGNIPFYACADWTSHLVFQAIRGPVSAQVIRLLAWVDGGHAIYLIN